MTPDQRLALAQSHFDGVWLEVTQDRAVALIPRLTKIATRGIITDVADFKLMKIAAMLMLLEIHIRQLQREIELTEEGARIDRAPQIEAS